MVFICGFVDMEGRYIFASGLFFWEDGTKLVFKSLFDFDIDNI